MTKQGKSTAVPRLRFAGFRDAWELKPLAPYLEECGSKVAATTSLPIYSSSRSGLTPQASYYDGRTIINEGEYGVVPPNCFVYRHMSDDGQFAFNLNETGSEIAVSKEYPVFRTVDLDSKFLLAKLNHSPHFKAFALSQKAGGTRTRLYFTKLQAWETFLPSLAEQQKIAGCLTSLDEVIAAQGRKVEALKTYKRGLMQQLFPRAGETLPRLRFPEFRDALEWETRALTNYVSTLDAGVSVNAGDRPATDAEIGILKTSCVTNGTFDPTENKVVVEPEELRRVKEQVQGDTIIMSRMNTLALVGANAYVERDVPNLFLPDRLWAAKPTLHGNMRFLSYILGSDQGRTFLSSLASGSSGSMKNISQSDVLAMPIAAPSPAEQRRIASCLSSLDSQISAEAQKLGALRNHKQGLMQQLFPSPEEA